MAATPKQRAFTQPKPTPQPKGQPVSWWLGAKPQGFTRLAEQSVASAPDTLAGVTRGALVKHGSLD